MIELFLKHMIKFLLYAIAVALIAILLCTISRLFSGCSQKLTSGEVYSKEFKPAETQTVMIPIGVTSGGITTTTLVPIFNHYPDRYIIYIRQFDKTKQKYITEDFYVNKEVYEGTPIGAEFQFLMIWRLTNHI